MRHPPRSPALQVGFTGSTDPMHQDLGDGRPLFRHLLDDPEQGADQEGALIRAQEGLLEEERLAEQRAPRASRCARHCSARAARRRARLASTPKAEAALEPP